LCGSDLVNWIWGGFAIINATLERFFILHFGLPIAILLLSCLHISLLHVDGSSTPMPVDSKSDQLRFSSYFLSKDFFSLIFFSIFFGYFVFFEPNYLGHPDNYIKADPLSTPVHIVPEWYFLPFYAVLRSIPDKLLGVCAMFLAIAVLAIFPLFISNFTEYELPNVKVQIKYHIMF
jgi:ubiquinol-cytochrome c reductase cytochrome b subunit